MELAKKQVIALDCREYQAIMVFGEISRSLDQVWATLESEVGSTGDHKIIETNLGWQIRKKGEPEKIGFAFIQGQKIGVLITYGVYQEESWALVDYMMDTFFLKLEEKGYKIYHPRNLINLPEVVYETEYQTIQRLPEEETTTDFYMEEDVNRKDFFPKSAKTIRKWKQAYRIIVQLGNEYKKLYKDNSTKNPSPKIVDCRDALGDKMGWKPSDKTIRLIISAGRAGRLR